MAGTVNSAIGASVLVTSSCSLSGTTLNFGNALNPVSGGATDATSTLTVQCTATTPYTISLNAGTNTGGGTNYTGRVLKSGSYSLPYQLYVDTGRTSIWGNGTASATYSAQGSGNPQNILIYGRLPSLTGIPPGVYTDTVTVTISY
ncbi:Spore coat protein U (SCPU) domain-containing protein [Roseateles sp. YR242]|uniref:Csu type fimbrial protein n=1 Tax=Roseateles sp. YR242 TaxID=1855305 RepID=UPI0008CAE3D1|nr:spore coat U domain-containing protein [Roseateles sp. YR242]SEK61326.1 Spore coat protein U (SCPU) domain-containing protein [Roseateles sp. YR242]